MEEGRGIQMPKVKTHQSPTTGEAQVAHNEVNIIETGSESKNEGNLTRDKVESDAEDTVSSSDYGTTANESDDVKHGDRNSEEVVTPVRDEYLVSRLVLHSFM
jgi:hypothetical protein